MTAGIETQSPTKRTVDLYDTHQKNFTDRRQTVALSDGPVTARTIIVSAGYATPIANSTLALDGVVIPLQNFDTPLDPVPQEATYIKAVMGG